MTTPSTSKTKSTSSTPLTSLSPITPSQSTKNFDVYASKFIPAWLQSINRLPAFQRLFSPIPQYTDFEEYSQTFLPKPLFQNAPSSLFLMSIKHSEYALDVLTEGQQ